MSTASVLPNPVRGGVSDRNACRRADREEEIERKPLFAAAGQTQTEKPAGRVFPSQKIKKKSKTIKLLGSQSKEAEKAFFSRAVFGRRGTGHPPARAVSASTRRHALVLTIIMTSSDTLTSGDDDFR